MRLSETLKYDANGLIPAVIQDATNHEVLMVGYMNAEAVDRTAETKRVTYWSRSRKKFWVKGETSGHFQHLKEMRIDCDKDCLLLFVDQIGPACHEGYRSCFYRTVNEDDEQLTVCADQIKTPEEIYGSNGFPPTSK